MALRRGAAPAALTAAKPNPFQAMQDETQTAEPPKGMPEAVDVHKPAIPMTMGKSHTPPGAKRRPLKLGKM